MRKVVGINNKAPNRSNFMNKNPLGNVYLPAGSQPLPKRD